MIKNLAETLYNKLKLKPQDFGYAGEVYINQGEMNLEYQDIVRKYVFTYQNVCINRKEVYYSNSFTLTCKMMKETYADYKAIYSTSLNNAYKRYLLFTVTEYNLNSLCKLTHICSENKIFRDRFYLQLKLQMEEVSQTLVNLMFNDFVPGDGLRDAGIIDDIEAFYKSEKEPVLREHVEYDHKLLLIFAYILNNDVITDDTLLICPLLGAVLIPPFLKALDRYLGESRVITYDYIKYSTYDIGNIIGLDEQSRMIKEAHEGFDKVLLLDESLSTGATLLQLKEALQPYFGDIRLGAVEFRWDKKIVFNNVRDWFDIEIIDYISAITYRHYLLLSSQIESFKLDVGNVVRYKPFMIYNDLNFKSYMSKQNIKESKTEALNVMFNKCRKIEEVFCKI